MGKCSPRNLLVDLDGTLLGNHGVALGIDFVKEAFKFLKPYGGAAKISTILLAIHRELNTTGSLSSNDVRVVKLFSQRTGLDLEAAREVLKQSIQSMFPKFKRHFFPIPGAKDFLVWAKDHFQIYLATNPVWSEEIVRLRLEWAGIPEDFFKSITHVRRMTACKPAAQYYRQILSDEKLEAKECLLIGDRKDMDLPAVKVGIPVFIVGKFSKISEITPKGSHASAWQGSYHHLRSLLESSFNSSRMSQNNP